MKLGGFSISLSVKNLRASIEFYEKLGFEKVGGDEEQHWLIVRNGDCTIGLFEGMFDRNTLTFNPGWDQQGELLNSVYYIQQGVARIERDGRLSEVGAGDFIGELAFVRSTTASAGVTVMAGAVLLEFDSQKIKSLMASSSSFSNAILALFNRDMAAKLSVSWPDEAALASRQKDKIINLVPKD